MTAISTLASIFMMPMNLYFYTRLLFNNDVTSTLDWVTIWVSLGTVIIAILMGLVASANHKSRQFHLLANRVGNFAGIALVLFSAVLSNSHSESRLWDREWQFYAGVALPCLLGLVLANLLSVGLNLLRPETVTVVVECCIQNCGIATSLSVSLFNGEQLARAIAVPFYYGTVECVVVTIYCWVAWKSAWTKAPVDISAWKMISTSYEILTVDELEDDTGKDDNEGFHYVKDLEVATARSI